MTQYKIKNLVTNHVANTLYQSMTAAEIQIARLCNLVPNYSLSDFEVVANAQNMSLRDIVVGEQYYVSKGTEDGTFEKGDIIILYPSRVLVNKTTNGELPESFWENYVDEVEVE